MNAQVMIIASGEYLDKEQTQLSLQSIQGLSLKPVEQNRGFAAGAVKAAKWVGEFLGGSGKIADMLIEQATKEMAGASLEIQVGTTVVKVSNINRSQIVGLLDKAAEIALKKSNS